MCCFVKKVNGYLVQRPKLLLALVWIFLVIALGIGLTILIVNPAMPLLKFWGCIIVPTALALYCRVLYSKVQQMRREERRAQKAEENQVRYAHKKKKK